MNKTLLLGAGILMVLTGAAFFSFQRMEQQKKASETVSQPQIQSTGFADIATSTATSSLPIADTLVYRRIKDVVYGDEDISQEYVFFNVPTKSKEPVDTAKQYDVRDEIGNVPILYYFGGVSDKSSQKDLLAYDFHHLYKTAIAVSTTDISFSSVVLSPQQPQVGYCSDEQEGTFYLLDLASKKKKSYPQFSCPADGVSYSSPKFSPDGRFIFYQDFGTFSTQDEEGVTNDAPNSGEWKFLALNVQTGDVTSVSTLMTTPERISLSQRRFASIETCSSEALESTYNNCVKLYETKLTDSSGKSTTLGREAARIVFPGEHIGDVMFSQSGDTLYAYAQKGESSGDYVPPTYLYIIDATTGKLKTPPVSIPSAATLLAATDSYLAFIGSEKGESTGQYEFNLYTYGLPTNSVTTVEKGTGLAEPSSVYAFVIKP
jgi:hypothetical protein